MLVREATIGVMLLDKMKLEVAPVRLIAASYPKI